MHQAQVEAKWVCAEERLRQLNRVTRLRQEQTDILVELYEHLLRSCARIDVAPLRVVQNSLGHLDVLPTRRKDPRFITAYVLACYRLRKPVRVISRKPLRALGTACPFREGGASDRNVRPLTVFIGDLQSSKPGLTAPTPKKMSGACAPVMGTRPASTLRRRDQRQ
jgi:hypothetical protein